ncbi:hypothetical protein LINPERHAP2_LOCUS24093 [Linum perenne]
MVGPLVPLLQIWVAVLLLGRSYAEPFWGWSWHGPWAAVMLNSSLTRELLLLSFNKSLSLVTNMLWKFLRTSSLIGVTTFLLGFICFHFLIVICLICFGTIIWECRLFVTF